MFEKPKILRNDHNVSKFCVYIKTITNKFYLFFVIFIIINLFVTSLIPVFN